MVLPYVNPDGVNPSFVYTRYPCDFDDPRPTDTRGLPVTVDNKTPVKAEVVNRQRESILAIEAELGIQPSGTFTTVRARLDALDSLIWESDGYVEGPSSSTYNAIARFEDSTGKLIQNSVVTISDTGDIQGATIDGYNIPDIAYDVANINLTSLNDVNGITSPLDGYYLRGNGSYWQGRVFSNDVLSLADVKGASSSTDNAIARFNLTTGKLIQNSLVTISDTGIIDGVNSVSLNLLPNGSYPSWQEGLIFYDSTNHTLVAYNDQSDVTQQIGQEFYLRIVNKTGVIIPNGSVVYVNGAQENRPTVALAQANDPVKVLATGIATHDIAINQEGLITIKGTVNGIDTRAFTAGDFLYVSPSVAGGLTNIKPLGQHYVWFVGVALNSTVNGSVVVSTQGPINLTSLHDVNGISSALDGYYLRGDGTIWEGREFSSDVLELADVKGPVSSTDNAIARFDLSTGKLIQNSVVTISDTGNIQGATIDGYNIPDIVYDVAYNVTYRDSLHVAGRAELPQVAQARVGSHVTCGNLGDEFVAIAANTYPIDKEFVIASIASPGVQWVWRNPETGRLGFDPSESLKWVCALSAERILLRHNAGTITDAIVDGGWAASTGEQLTAGYGGTPTLSESLYGGKPGLSFDTSSWIKFVLPDRCHPDANWGYLCSTQLTDDALTANHNVLDVDSGATDTDTYRLGIYDASEMFHVMVTDSTTRFNSVANDELYMAPIRGPSLLNEHRQTFGFFSDTGYTTYCNCRPGYTKSKIVTTYIGDTAPVVYINVQANGANIGSQVFNRIDFFNGYPGDLYLRNYDRYVNAGLPDIRVICIGDSITWGAGLSNEQSWPVLLSSDSSIAAGFDSNGVTAHYNVENLGISGWQTGNVIQALSSRIGPFVPFEGRVRNGRTITIVLIGINDVIVTPAGTDIGERAAEISDRIYEICDRLTPQGAYVILQTLLPATSAWLDTDKQSIRTSINNTIINSGTNHADSVFQSHIISGLTDPTGAGYGDGLHPSATGAALLAAALVPEIQVVQLLLGLQDIYGDSLVAFWHGNDMQVISTINVASVTGRIDSNVTNLDDTVYLNTGTVGGRKAWGADSSGTKVLRSLSVPAYKSVVAVATSPALPFTTWQDLVRSTTYLIEGYNGQSNLRQPANQTIYVDGNNTLDMASGTHILEASGAIDYTRIDLGGNDGGGTWLSYTGLVYCLNAQQTEAQREAANALLRDHFSIPPGSAWLANQIALLIPTGITTLCIGDDVVVSGGEINEWANRTGSNITPVSTAKASVITVNGRKGGLFSTNAAAMGYGLATGQLTQIAVARWDDTLTLPGYCGLIGGQNATSGRLITDVGVPHLYNSAGEIIYRDGRLGDTIDNEIHIWESNSATSNTSSRQLGCGDSTPAGNWRGPIFFVLQASIQLSTEQRSGLVELLRQYYGLEDRAQKLSALVSNLTAIYGSDLTEIWVGDAVQFDVATRAAAWPGSKNSLPLNYQGSYFGESIVNGRVGILAPDTTTRWLENPTSTAPKSIVAVAVAPTIPVTAQCNLAMAWGTSGTDASIFVATDGTWSASGWTHYCDGYASADPGVGLHVYQADKATNTTPGVRVGGLGGTVPYPADILTVMSLSVVPTDEQRAAHTALLEEYYSI
jgi:lysophospholipase L1-like esterase